MTPATHAAVAALVASRSRKLWVALAAAFGLHFVLDVNYHFEAFYPLSVPGGWSYQQSMLVLLGVLAVLSAPAAVFVLRKERDLWIFAAFALLMCAVPFEPIGRWRLAWAALLAAVWLAASPTVEGRKWIICGFVAYLPDCLKAWFPWFRRLHDAAHYDSRPDLGDWVSLLAQGRWNLHVNRTIYDPWYQLGYALEIGLEAAILFGCLYALRRRRRESA